MFVEIHPCEKIISPLKPNVIQTLSDLLTVKKPEFGGRFWTDKFHRIHDRM